MAGRLRDAPSTRGPRGSQWAARALVPERPGPLRTVSACVWSRSRARGPRGARGWRGEARLLPAGAPSSSGHLGADAALVEGHSSRPWAFPRQLPLPPFPVGPLGSAPARVCVPHPADGAVVDNGPRRPSVRRYILPSHFLPRGMSKTTKLNHLTTSPVKDVLCVTEASARGQTDTHGQCPVATPHGTGMRRRTRLVTGTERHLLRGEYEQLRREAEDA